MKIILRNKKTTAIALVLLMASVMLTLYTPVEAQEPMPIQPTVEIPAGVTPSSTVNCMVSLSVRPRLIGVGQSLLINMFMEPASSFHRQLIDFTLTITKPDETEKVYVVQPYVADSTAWMEYVVDQVGEWKFQFHFGGTYFPAGRYLRGVIINATSGGWNYPTDAYYAPGDSPEVTITVQEEMVYSWPPAPLPTDYWTRPAPLNNREWWPILGSWPGTGYNGRYYNIAGIWDTLYPNTSTYYDPRCDFHPWVTGPNTAHIVWKQQGEVAGLIGGPAGQYGDTSNPGGSSVIYMGRVYQTYTKPGVGSVAACYDLRTGEIYYEIPTAEGGVTPNYVIYIDAERDPEKTSTGATSGTWNVELVDVSGGTLYKVNAWSGAVSEYPVSPLNDDMLFSQVDGYFLDVQNLGGGNYALINWTCTGSTSNVANRIISNTSYASSSLPRFQDWESGYGADYIRGNTIWCYDLYTGENIVNATNVPGGAYNRDAYCARNGLIAYQNTYGGYWTAYEMDTGRFVWKGENGTYPWGWSGWGAYSKSTAYGLIYAANYDGVHAWNWTDGNKVWTYTAPAFANFESPYVDGNQAEVYSFDSGLTVADGVVYAMNSEHSTTWPITRGWGLHAIDAITGERIWKIKNQLYVRGIADGYLLASNYWDGYRYCFGRGKSATTVTAPKTGIPLGQSVVIEGTVLDISPAQPGTPCVSKESMTLQMEYLHMQQPITGLWNNETVTGVPVSLDIVDPNGNFFHIADVTTDGYSGTFSFMWTPEIEGQYTVMANFMGDESYGSSFAQTAVGVVEAPEPYPEPPEYGTAEWPEYPDAPAYTAVDLAIIVAVAIAIVIGIISLLDHRRLRK